MASNIGIKIANGEFYPLIGESSLTRKRLILTTVHDNQPSVQIDLFRSTVGVMADAQYIGSLVVENIKPRPKGEPSIEMVVSSNSRGEIIADAIDLDTSAGGEHHVLTVSLKSLDETSRDMEIPDFELEANEEPPSSLYNKAKKERKKKGSSKAWIFVLIGIILLLGLLAAWLFMLGGLDIVKTSVNWPITLQSVWQKPVKQNESVRPPEPAPEPVKISEPVQEVVQPAPVIQAPAAAPAPRQETVRRRPPAPVASYNVPAVIPREGVSYIIRWGDTLWDIADAFYRDPWLYPRIARHNNIRNPNLIISGRTIRIPPKN